ncbi:MAG: glutamine synthetase family protein [Acidimicrobiia bacterium]|nr:glutamine synthetase family protein [Acidimicrobiia bacterium]
MGSPDYERIRVLYPDVFGFARGKYVPIAAATGQMNFSIAIFGVGYDRALIPAPGADVLHGLGDMTAVYDLEKVRPWWQAGTGVVIADLLQNGAPLEISPRHALVKAVDDLAAAGVVARVGIEIEAYVLQPDGRGGREPWDTPSAYCYGTGPLVDPIGLLDEIMAAATASGIALETTASEYDSPQFELTIEHDDPLTAIDHTFLLKLLCREAATRHGLMLTFLGRPFGDRGGNGLHVNISFQDDSGEHLFCDPGAEDGLSAMARHGIGGMLGHHEALAALCAPTVNAYKRLRPGQLSGYWANWGYDHRAVAVRVPSARGPGTRLESRLPDGAANPYVATAALLQASLLGVRDQVQPPPHEEGDGLETANTERCSPENLSLALDALEADIPLTEAVGSALVANFVAMKREEWRRFSEAVTDWELDEYLTYH